MKLHQCRNCRREVDYSLVPNKGRCNACHANWREKQMDEDVQTKPVYLLKDAEKYGVEGGYYYQGYVYGNPNFEDGAYIHTSSIVAEVIGKETGKVVAIETRNSHYDLN